MIGLSFIMINQFNIMVCFLQPCAPSLRAACLLVVDRLCKKLSNRRGQSMTGQQQQPHDMPEIKANIKLMDEQRYSTLFSGASICIA